MGIETEWMRSNHYLNILCSMNLEKGSEIDMHA